MLDGIAAIKAQSRQALHGALAVSAFYSDALTPETPEPNCKVRWHNKLARNGALDGNFAGEIIEGVDRLVFQEPEVISSGLTLRQKGRVRIPGLAAIFTLELEEPRDGPLNIYWSVSHERQDDED